MKPLYNKLLKESIILITILIVNKFVFAWSFSYIHEYSHGIISLLFGKKPSIHVYYPRGGYTTISFDNYYLTKEELIQYRIILIAGSIGSVLTVLLLIFILYRKTRFSIFLAFFIFVCNWILFESYYWISDINDFILNHHYFSSDDYYYLYEGSSDAYSFLHHTPFVSPYFLRFILLTMMIIIFLWLISILILRIKKININTYKLDNLDN